MHDATEAYIGDVVKPLKIMLPEYSVIERRIEKAIGEAFGIDFDAHQDVIKEIDQAVLIAERRRLFSPDKETWTGENDVRAIDITCRCLRPGSAYAEFIDLFRRIERTRK
ncbi:hypothetical protein SH661x_000395 [Planctomicrobium sp. SH661]|uniref:hypothetical protein n=1 Tax=Planctomicrobium sp. SH661 TaxID=3448124 RepID=UPI003F5C8CAF